MVKNKLKHISIRIQKFLFRCVLYLFLFTLLQVVVMRFINPPFTPNIAWEWVESIILDDPKKIPAYQWKNIESISAHLRRAAIAAEDQRFLSHKGFDYKEIQQAFSELFRQKKLRGASTISMQTARSLFLLSSRSVFRKVAEIYYTCLIELFWSKQRILEMYLNTVDWGTGVTGAEAAAQKYFSKSAGKLTPSESALMTAILPNPHRWSVKDPTPYLKKRQQQIMKDLYLMPLL